MVQVVENWAILTGVVAIVAEEQRPVRGSAAAWREVGLTGVTTEEVGGFPNLLRSRGPSLTVRAPARAAASVAPGDRVRCRARLASPRVILVSAEGFAPAAG